MSSEGNKDPKDGQNNAGATGTGQQGQQSSTQKIEVSVENKSTEQLIEMLKAEEQKRKDAEALTKKAQEDLQKKADELEGLKTDSDNYKSKLQIIADKQFIERKTAIEGKAKSLLKDDAKLKAVMDKIKEPADLQATEFMLDTLQGALQTGQAELDKAIKTRKDELVKNFPDAKAQIEATKNLDEIETLSKTLKPADNKGSAAGAVPLSNQGASGYKSEGYDTHMAMIQDLRKKERSSNPEEAAEAKAILNELFKKWTVAVKKQYGGKMPQGIDIELDKDQPSVKDITGQKDAQQGALQRKK